MVSANVRQKGGRPTLCNPGQRRAGQALIYTTKGSKLDRACRVSESGTHGKTSHSQYGFKRQVAQEFIAGETLHGLAKRHDVSRTLIRIWVRKYKAQSMKMLRRPTSSRNTKPASPRSTVSLETGAGIGASKEGSEKRAAAEKRD